MLYGVYTLSSLAISVAFVIVCPQPRWKDSVSTGNVRGDKTFRTSLRASEDPIWRRGINWFGTDKLWTYLPSNGISGQGEKTIWFREEWSHYNHWIPDESALKLTITARRLDATTPPPEISAGPTFNRDWKAFMLGGINFPTPGCWEITGRYEDAEVQYVVWVVPDAPAKQTQDRAAPLSIIVDKSCRIEPESDPLILGDHA